MLPATAVAVLMPNLIRFIKIDQDYRIYTLF